MRFITFTIPGAKTNVVVTLEEQADGTVLVKLTQQGDAGDLRGLFFDINDASLIPHLSVKGAHVSGFQARNEAVLDLGQGANMQGNPLGAFDVGVRFGTPGAGKDVITSTSFVLSSAVGGLTLDDLALADIGVRLTSEGAKMVRVMPAAPDAIDDNLAAVEDVPVVYNVLANDTDADGTAGFRIVKVSDPEHGTATISADGKSIIYVADPNYSGPDSFTYDMIDGTGGGDTAKATIAVEAVADAPTLTLTTAPGATVNQILLTVSAAVTDTDGSEYLDRFDFAGLPTGATIVGESDLVFDPASTTQTLSKTFTIELAPGNDFNFALGVTAWAKEASNGDEEGTTVTQKVLVESNSRSFDLSFEANDQSIWNSGNAFTVTDDRFLGFEVDPGEASFGGFIYGKADLYLKAGFQSTLSFTGGSVDAVAPYKLGIDTTYNHVTDVLLIESFADLLSGGVSFSTTGPGGRYVLDFIFNYALKASAGIDFGVDEFDLFSFNTSNNWTLNILDVDSADLSVEFEFPYGLSITLAWPDVDTSSLVTTSGSLFTSSGASNNFLELGVDLDQALADIFLSGVNPFDIGFDITVAWGNAELLDVDLSAGMNFIQDFTLALQGLNAQLRFEDGSSRAWDFSDLVINQASLFDTDNDGKIEFDLILDQQAQLTNSTDLGFNLGYQIDVLKASGGYDFLVDSGEWSVGPVWSTGQVVPIGQVEIYGATFGLDFAPRTIGLEANDILLA